MDTVHAAPVHTTVVGVFDDAARARAAVEDLRRAKFAARRIRFLGPKSRKPGKTAENRDWIVKEMDEGKSLVIVREADERAEDVRDILRRHHASIQQPSDIGTYGTGLPATPF
jgi:hypothetical protein